MDVLANHGIFQELQLVHDTGYFSAMPSLEENWQQVTIEFQSLAISIVNCSYIADGGLAKPPKCARITDIGVNFPPIPCITSSERERYYSLNVRVTCQIDESMKGNLRYCN